MMDDFLTAGIPVLVSVTVVMSMILAAAALTSWAEKQQRAAFIILLGLLIVPVLMLLPLLARPPLAGYLAWAELMVLLAMTGYLLIPGKRAEVRSDAAPVERLDERTIMFARAELKPGTDRYEEYYGLYPEHLAADERFRRLPGLLQSGSLFEHPLLFGAAQASFETVEKLYPLVEGEVAESVKSIDKEKVTRFLLGWCQSMGAHSAATCRTKAEHYYSIRGRRENWGKAVDETHEFALVFTVEMDHDHVRMAPQSPITLESSRRYLHAAEIAVQLAQWIRSQGYPARAHIDGNYLIRCPQIARDAGLGELGRMGILMTPDLGPRVRIGVVSTDMPLHVLTARRDPSVADFCSVCKKCAVLCPSQAIPHDDMQMQNGQWQWTIKQEKCYSYWCQVGTDCGRCVAVCPYSHPDNWMHRSVRWLIKRSGRARRVAVVADNLLYGKKPQPLPLDGWMDT